MIRAIYYIILIYFLLGGIAFYIINRKKDPAVAKESYTKFGVYFLIINALFFSITINPAVFHFISIIIVLAGLWELFKLYKNSGFQHKGFFFLALLVFAILSFGFIAFGGFEKGLILFAFLVLSIFDSFSQITGQLWGRKKLFPEISPKKTVGGLVGGTLVALVSSYLLKDLYAGQTGGAFVLAGGVILFAFAGDLSASYYKRKFGVKDFSKLIPGHGGLLDRFDSLIAGGAWVALYMLVF
ncbi:MAG: phosphatidate cytidylyltransferase [Draconibacterium sp.]